MNQIKTMNMLIERMKFISIGILLIFFSGNLFSQQDRSLELGLFGGGAYYIGDINPGVPFILTQPAYGAVARYNVNRRWTFKLSYTRSKVAGNDLQTEAVEGRDLDFKTKINDFSLIAEFNFWDYFTGSKKNYMSPYLFGGVSYFTFKTASMDGVSLQPMGTEGQNIGFDGRSPYKQSNFAFPFGIGFKYSLTKRLGMSVEWGMRKTFTDYLDDVSTTYYFDAPSVNNPDEAEILSDPTMTHNAYMQRGNEKTKDWYSFAGVTLTYKLNLYNKRKCNTSGW